MASFDDYPLQPPPPGQLSNFIDPKSRGPVVVAVCCTFISLMWLILLSRLYSKAWVIRIIGWDDGNTYLLFQYDRSLLMKIAFATLAAVRTLCHKSAVTFNLKWQKDRRNGQSRRNYMASRYQSNRAACMGRASRLEHVQ